MSSQVHYALCVKNRGYAAALEVRKLYRVISDQDAATHGLIRVVDESGEDYLYPTGFFLWIELSRDALKALSKKSA